MVRWELAEFRAEKADKNILGFKADILIPDEMYNTMHTLIKFIYDGQKFMVNGSELELGYSIYEIKRRLESLLENNLINVLSKHSREEEYLRAFRLIRMGVHPYDKVVMLDYAYNDKFLTVGDLLVKYPHSIGEELCKEPLRAETNAVSDIKSFYELLAEICRSKVRINIDLNNINEIIEILLQAIEV